MTQIEVWAREAALEAAERLGLPDTAVELCEVDGQPGIGVRLRDGRLACIPVRSSYPRPQLLRLARKLMRQAG